MPKFKKELSSSIPEKKLRAIKTRLTKERAHRDRWERAIEYLHENEWRMVGIDLETGDSVSFPDLEE